MTDYRPSSVSVTYWECDKCGAVVADKDVHDKWHEDVRKDSNLTHAAWGRARRQR